MSSSAWAGLSVCILSATFLTFGLAHWERVGVALFLFSFLARGTSELGKRTLTVSWLTFIRAVRVLTVRRARPPPGVHEPWSRARGSVAFVAGGSLTVRDCSCVCEAFVCVLVY